MDSLIWKRLAHGGRVRRTFLLDGGPIEVRITDIVRQNGLVFVAVDPIANHRVGATPAHFIALKRLTELN